MRTISYAKQIEGETIPLVVPAIEDGAPISWAYDVFVDIDKKFDEVGGHERSLATPRGYLEVYRTTKPGTLRDMFESLSRTGELSPVCFTLAQIRSIIESNHAWAVGRDTPIFFPFDHKGRKYAACANVSHFQPTRLIILAFDLEDQDVWPERLGCLLVIPKQ